jgi:hypothetical protein
MDIPRVGKYVGGGGYKSVYQLGPSHVVAIMGDDSGRGRKARTVRKEYRDLKTLHQLGFRVPRDLKVIRIQTERGDVEWGLHMEALAEPWSKHTHSNNQPDFDGRKLVRKQLRAIKRLARKLDVEIGDFQFMLDKHGTVVIMDPLWVEVGQGADLAGIEDCIEDWRT